MGDQLAMKKTRKVGCEHVHLHVSAGLSGTGSWVNLCGLCGRGVKVRTGSERAFAELVGEMIEEAWPS